MVIVVTGATKGLGRALVTGFAQAGHTVAGCGRTTEAIDELSLELGGPHMFRAVDVADGVAVEQWAQETVERLGAPELVINNAGIINRNAPLWEVGLEEFEALLRINIGGTFHVIRAFLPTMLNRGSGVIANLSSGWGRCTAPEVAPYCTSKWAIEGLTRALAQELPAGLAAVAVNPGIVDTEMLRSCWGAEAGGFPSAKAWAVEAVPFFLGLSAIDNGRAATI